MGQKISEKIFSLSNDIRYVALYLDDKLVINQREDIVNASHLESDHYEELLVNPTLLKLLGQRGNIDCGGLEYVMIRYGNFYQLVMPVKGGHLSVSFELDADPQAYLSGIQAILQEHGRI
jgi:hypothetical protein